MNRRDSVAALLALGAATGPLATWAQPPVRVFRVGTIMFGSAATSGHLVEAFIRGLRNLGYVEAANIAVERRYANGVNERLPELAAELAQRNVDVIVTASAPATQAAKKASAKIPIVQAIGGDPVVAGFAASLAHPGGNVTGMTHYVIEFAAKRLELLREVYPKASRVAVFYSLSPLMSASLAEALRATKILGLETLTTEVRDDEDLTRGFEVARKWHADSMLPLDVNQLFFARKLLAELAAQYRLPAIYVSSGYAEAGGLISYGADFADLMRRAAVYVDKILKGAKPGDLPIEQPTRFELVINLKTAKGLGNTNPKSVLFRADRLIE